jgi:hypothetical protein
MHVMFGLVMLWGVWGHHVLHLPWHLLLLLLLLLTLLMKALFGAGLSGHLDESGLDGLLGGGLLDLCRGLLDLCRDVFLLLLLLMKLLLLELLLMKLLLLELLLMVLGWWGWRGVVESRRLLLLHHLCQKKIIIYKTEILKIIQTYYKD